jgi:hypothetical protein
MLTRFFRKASLLALVAGVAFLGSAEPARAALTIDYVTTGAFNNNPLSPGGSPVTYQPGGVGTISLTFTGVNPGMVTLFDPPLNLTSSDASLGTFTASGGTNFLSLNGVAFTLYITQSAPPPTGGSPATFDAALSGVIQVNGSDAEIVFNNPLTQIVTSSGTVVTYTVPKTFALVPSTTNGGIATLQGTISAVPEPATLVSTALGLPLLGLGTWVRRRRRSS